MSFRSANSSSSANSITASSRSSACSRERPIKTPLRITFSRAVRSALKPTPSSMNGATEPAMRIEPDSGR